MIDEHVRYADLFDLYGELLTERQQQCCRMRWYDDFSLAEIAELLRISRQAVNDTLKRAVAALNGYESKLHLQYTRG